MDESNVFAGNCFLPALFGTGLFRSAGLSTTLLSLTLNPSGSVA